MRTEREQEYQSQSQPEEYVSARETARLIGSDKLEGTAVRRSNGDKVGTIARKTDDV